MIDLLNKKVNYFFLCIISFYLLLLLINADNHSNETFVELNSTSINVITNDTKSNETISFDDIPSSNDSNNSSSIDLTTSTLETTVVDLLNLNTTSSGDNNITTIISIASSTEINTDQTTINSKTTCESGCCTDDECIEKANNNKYNDTGSIINSTSTVDLQNETEFTSTISSEVNATNVSESVDVTVENVTETTISIINQTDSTTSDMKISQNNEIFETSTQKIIETTTIALETTTFGSLSCADSEYECCPDGETPAQGHEFQGCNTTVRWAPPTAKVFSQNVCELEKDAGSCSKYVYMWAYDRRQGKCVRFWYGSCEGNGNRFETEQQCQETCVNPKGIEICLLPRITGPCQSSGSRYYYDRDAKDCQEFRYGGCNGNGNNYRTIEECRSTCPKETIDQCTQSVEIGPCKGEFNRFYYDTVTGQCRSFTYGGCKKNLNNFLTLNDCLKTCIEPRQKDTCLQPKIIGTCQERQPAWYFDIVERECKLFHYSGCKGNYNRFSTKEECDVSCSSLKTSANYKDDIKSLCHLPVARGTCDQQISRWYYNPNDQYCHPFQYTGCHGNVNSFETEQNCREICQAKERDICTLEKDAGTCDQYKIMWYYDTSNGQCKTFYYGSCGGNQNRFGTEQECQLRCLLKEGNSTCFQHVDQGHVCNDTKLKNQTSSPLMKVFYDQQLKKCVGFLYHGCGGNDNRFDDENECTAKCVSDVSTSEQGCGSNMVRCNIQCRFGFERDPNGCEICRCFEPCQKQQCPSGYECVIIPEQVPCTQAPCPVPRVECQLINGNQLNNPNGGIKPVIENSITNIFAQFDSNVTIPCTIRQGYPTPSIYWYKERQQLQVYDAISNGYIVRKMEKLPDQSLIIRKLNLEDQGLYTCRAINDFGQDIKDVQLDIFDPIKVDIYPINRVYQLDFTAKLQCRATGYPLPRVIWMRDNTPLVNTTRIKLQNDGSLIIHPYKQEDAGPYVCNATNKKESVTQVAYLEIKETNVEKKCEDRPSFANCELVLRHNFCDVYVEFCCHTCSQHSSFHRLSRPKSRRHVFF